MTTNDVGPGRTFVATAAVIRSVGHRGRRTTTEVATVGIEVFAVVVLAGLGGSAVGFVVAAGAFAIMVLTGYVMILGRTYDIGVQRAVGATRLDVVLATEGEVLALCTAGSVGGLGVAWSGEWLLLAANPAASFELSLSWAAKAVTAVIVGAVLGSSFPLARLVLSTPITSLRRT